VDLQKFIWRKILNVEQNPLLVLNIDEKLPYHFIIGVAIHTMRSKERGKMFLKYGPLRFTNDDIKRLQNAALLSTDKLFKTSQLDCIKIANVEELVSTFSAMKLSCAVNQCSLHHFSSEYDIEDEWFDTLVKMANTDKHSEELLDNAQINYKPFHFGQ
jgi:hypothetical protein